MIYRALTACVLLAAAGLIGWRTLGPAEVLEPAAEPYPVAATLPAGVTGKTALAPLIVDGRLRVYAGPRVVKADAPVDAKTMYTPRWSYRRWPERLTGLVAAGPVVITRWSDGELVALDGRTGTIAWRSPTDPVSDPPTQAGSGTVWAPLDLHVTGTSVLINDGRRLAAYAVADGAQRWAAQIPRDCGAGFVTAGGQYVCAAGAWDVLSGQPVPDWPAGPSTALGCDVANSGCAGLRDGSGQGWLTGAGRPQRAPALDAPEATAAGDLVLSTAGGEVVASRAGNPIWRWAGQARVLGVRVGKVVLLTPDERLVTLDAATGAQRAAFPLYVQNERVEPWEPGRWQLTDSFAAIERLAPGAKPYPTDAMIIAAI